MRSGFVTLAGRPNVGKSTLLNTILGRKVSITSDKPQTTRAQVRGVLDLPAGHPAASADDVQIVFVDTPGVHKPVSALGHSLNRTATDALGDVDVACLVLDATAPLGRGDRYVAERLPADAIVVVNKVDAASPAQVLAQLAAAAELDREAYFPVSARVGEGVAELVAELAARMPEGPRYYPEGMVTDTDEGLWVAELVREQLYRALREEMPYSIATRVTDWEWPRIRCEILVERESQKGMVIGKKGALLKQVGIAVREQLPPGAYLELRVKVDKDWQRRPASVQRLGY